MPTDHERIYLQNPEDEEEGIVGSERTWCQDRINDGDTEYVRVDLYRSMAAQLAAYGQHTETCIGIHMGECDCGFADIIDNAIDVSTEGLPDAD